MLQNGNKVTKNHENYKAMKKSCENEKLWKYETVKSKSHENENP